MLTSRIFPRRTKATPTDKLAFTGLPGLPRLLPEIAAVHVSVAPVQVGGPALGTRASVLVPTEGGDR